jgi:anti-sigma factor RsiW
LVELVTEYLEGTLSPEDRKQFEAHLGRCEGCTNYLAQMRHTIRLSGKMTEDQLSPEAKDELLALFRDWKAG